MGHVSYLFLEGGNLLVQWDLLNKAVKDTLHSSASPPSPFSSSSVCPYGLISSQSPHSLTSNVKKNSYAIMWLIKIS